MGENWLWAIFQDRMETLTATNLGERTDPEWRTKLLRSLRNIVIDLDQKVQLTAVDRALTDIGEAPARHGMISLLQKYAKESGAEWAKEALDNFETESTAAGRIAARKQLNTSAAALHIKLEEAAEQLACKLGDGHVPRWLNEIRTLIKNGVAPEPQMPTTAAPRRAKGPDSKWLMKRLEESLAAVIEDGFHRLSEPRLRGLKRISLALNDGSFDRDYGNPLYDDYIILERVLRDAYLQASEGKGKERHANGLPFDQQKIFTISRQVGDGYVLGQAMKKLAESQGMPNSGDAYREILGAINYAAAAAALRAERMPAPEYDEDPFPEDL